MKAECVYMKLKGKGAGVWFPAVLEEAKGKEGWKSAKPPENKTEEK